MPAWYAPGFSRIPVTDAGNAFNAAKFLMTITNINERAAKIRLVLTDVDGVLTDSGVYYGKDGEVMKRFSIRDGMGVERLRDAGIEVGIVTGEKSESVVKRAEKLHIEMVHLLCQDKPSILRQIMEQHKYETEEIAYIGDDVNDIEVMKLVGLAACPADAFPKTREVAHYVCRRPGGHGAFREFAELILEAKNPEVEEKQAMGFQ